MLCAVLVMPHFSNWFAFIIVGLTGLVMCGSPDTTSAYKVLGGGSDEHHVCVLCDSVFSDNTFLFPNE